MRSLLTALSVLLVAQLALAAGLLWFGNSGSAVATNTPLLQFDSAEVSRITLEDGTSSTELVRSTEQWTLPELDNAPADATKVRALLTRLQELRAGWPVSRSPSGHARFEVEKDNFQRRVRLYTPAGLAADLLLGTSSGFRQVHARQAGAEPVYAIELSTFDLPANAADWQQPEPAADEPAPAADSAPEDTAAGPPAPTPDG